MTRYAVDADVALRLALDERSIDPAHRLVAAATVRSLMMTQLYRRMRSGALESKEAHAPVAAYEDLFVAHRRAESGGDTLDS